MDTKNITSHNSIIVIIFKYIYNITHTYFFFVINIKPKLVTVYLSQYQNHEQHTNHRISSHCFLMNYHHSKNHQ